MTPSPPRRPPLPGSEDEQAAVTRPAAADRGLPAAAVRRRRHAALPGGERPADAVRGARGALAAAVPAVRAGPPPPPDLAGGGAQVLPAGRVLLGVLPVRRRAAVRLRGLARTLSRHRRTPSGTDGRARRRCCSIGIALVAVGLLFKVGAVPFHMWTPDVYQGAPTPVTGFMAACTKVAAFGALLRVFYVALGGVALGLAADAVGVAILTMLVGVDHRDHPDRRQAACWPTPRSRTPGFILVGVLALDAGRASRRRCSTCVAYGFTTVGAFAVVTLVRDAGGEATHLSQWAGPRPALAAGRRRLRVLPAGLRRHPADQRVHRQVRGVLGRDRRRRGAAGRSSACWPARSRRSSTSGSSC